MMGVHAVRADDDGDVVAALGLETKRPAGQVDCVGRVADHGHNRQRLTHSLAPLPGQHLAGHPQHLGNFPEFRRDLGVDQAEVVADANFLHSGEVLIERRIGFHDGVFEVYRPGRRIDRPAGGNAHLVAFRAEEAEVVAPGSSPRRT